MATAALSSSVGLISTSVEALRARVLLLLRFLEDVEAGRTKAPYSLLRRIKAVINRLPGPGDEAFTKELRSELADTLLTAYVAGLAKTSAALHTGRR